MVTNNSIFSPIRMLSFYPGSSPKYLQVTDCESAPGTGYSCRWINNGEYL
jgi:hypothetical protein